MSTKSKNKKVRRIIIAAMLILIGIFIKKILTPLPEVEGAEICTTWQDRHYTVNADNVLCYKLGKQIGKEVLIAMEGDTDYHIVYRTDTHWLYIENGYEVPTEGTITTVFVEMLNELTYEHSSSKPRWSYILKPEKVEAILSLFSSEYTLVEAKSEQKLSDESYNLYLCFDGWPVASKFLGTVSRTEDSILFIPNLHEDSVEEKNVNKAFIRYEDADSSSGEIYIKAGTKYFSISDDQVSEELNKLKKKFKKWYKRLHELREYEIRE